MVECHYTRNERSMMQTQREYLVSLGLAKPSRGRFSTAAKEALVKARKEGISFSDDVSTAPVVKEEKPTAPVRTPPTESPYICPSDFRFPEAEYVAVEVGGKNTHSMRECCNTCRVSLTNHGCDSPTVHGRPVRIVAVAGKVA